MKAEALAALQSVRMILTNNHADHDAVSELLEPIQRVLDGEYVLISGASVANHGAKVDLAMELAMDCYVADRDKPGLGKLFNELFDSIRALCL